MVAPWPFFEQLTPAILIKIGEVTARTGYKKFAIYDWVRKPKLTTLVRPCQWDAAEVEDGLGKAKLEGRRVLGLVPWFLTRPLVR